MTWNPRKAVVDDAGNIVTVAMVPEDGSWQPPKGTTLVDDPDGRAEPGGTWDGAVFAIAHRSPEFLAGTPNEPDEREAKIAAALAEINAKLDAQAARIAKLENPEAIATKDMTHG